MKHYPHAKNKYPNYNTFHVFEDIYRSSQNGDFNQLEIPARPNQQHFILKTTFLLIIVGLLGLTVHPLLSYYLKTPYPLVVIGENSMQPALAKNDLILVKGVITQQDIKNNDIIVYNDNPYANNSFSVQRVVSQAQDTLTIKNDADRSPGQEINYKQVIGKVVGQDEPLKLKWIGVLGKIINSNK